MQALSLSVLAGIVALPTMGCDLCAVYSVSEASGAAGRGFYAGLAEQYTRFGTLQEDGHKIANDGEYINSSVAQVFAGYTFSDRLSLQLNLPIIYRSFGSSDAHGSENGVGDLSLVANYRVYQKMGEAFTFTWTALGGVKFPTGDSARLGGDDFSAGIGGHDLALGSGSFDGVVGTGIFARWTKLFLTANTQYSIRSEGDFGHQYANDLTWSGGPGYFLALGHTYTLALQAVVSGEYKGKDTFYGVADPDSAETIVYLGPQVNFTWGGSLSAQAGVDVPVSIFGTGVQVVPDYRIHMAVTFRF